MRPHSRSRLVYAWIACWAVLLNALAPAVSAAIAAASERPRLWDEIRTRGGFAARARVDTPYQDDICGEPRGRQPQKHQPQGHPDAESGHCPFCFLHAGSFGAVAPAPLLLPAPLLPDAGSASVLLQPPPLAWRQTPAQARAPPRAR